MSGCRSRSITITVMTMQLRKQSGKMWHCCPVYQGRSLVAEVEVKTRIVSSGEKLAVGQDESVPHSAYSSAHNPIGWVATCQLPPQHLPVSNFIVPPTLFTPPIALNK